MKTMIGITGAASGLGRELSIQYAKKGYAVIGIDINLDQLSTLKDQLGELFHPIHKDIASKHGILDTCQLIYEQFGTPDIWFNNAGVSQRKSFHEISIEEFDLSLELNIKTVVYATRFWLDKMTTRKYGKIVNIGSVAGHIPTAGMLAYSTSKYALTGFTESLQAELEVEHSPVSLILASLGFVNTDMIGLGEKNGFPKELSFAITSVQKCVKHLIEGVEKSEKIILPTATGNLLLKFNRVSPQFTKIFSNYIGNRLLK